LKFSTAVPAPPLTAEASTVPGATAASPTAAPMLRVPEPEALCPNARLPSPALDETVAPLETVSVAAPSWPTVTVPTVVVSDEPAPATTPVTTPPAVLPKVKFSLASRVAPSETSSVPRCWV
jgi:hypothetical protein